MVPSIDAHILALGGGSGSSLGTGGMATKLKAAQIVTEVGCQMVIANGSKPALLYDSWAESLWAPDFWQRRSEP